MKDLLLHEAPPVDSASTEDVPVSAYERAAEEGVDPRCIPQYLEEAPPVGDQIVAPLYSDEHN
ncbi:MAG: hypothetical protein OXT73_03475 [Bacteroidota bacterium]|nr:hypothetical protein [Bacteroidota bacterium]